MESTAKTSRGGSRFTSPGRHRQVVSKDGSTARGSVTTKFLHRMTRTETERPPGRGIPCKPGGTLDDFPIRLLAFRKGGGSQSITDLKSKQFIFKHVPKRGLSSFLARSFQIYPTTYHSNSPHTDIQPVINHRITGHRNK